MASAAIGRNTAANVLSAGAIDGAAAPYACASTTKHLDIWTSKRMPGDKFAVF